MLLQALQSMPVMLQVLRSVSQAEELRLVFEQLLRPAGSQLKLTVQVRV